MFFFVAVSLRCSILRAKLKKFVKYNQNENAITVGAQKTGIYEE
jgi:hypothetical protein